VPKPPFLFGLLAVSFIFIHCYSKRKPARPVASIIRLNTWEVNNSEGKMFLVMECGEHDLAISMRNNRRPDGSLPDAQIASNWCQMLAGVHAIHQRKIIHGDLKPANFVFVGTTLKLIDFGIARSVEADHTSIVCESQMGTLNYMSPESVTPQIKNSKHAPGSLKIGPATDVWALGCILFAMVYGVPPFQHVTMPLLKLQAIADPDHHIEFKSTSNAAVLEVLHSCLEYYPAYRITVAQLREMPLPSTMTDTRQLLLNAPRVSISRQQLEAAMLDIQRLPPALPETVSRRLFNILHSASQLIPPSSQPMQSAVVVAPKTPKVKTPRKAKALGNISNSGISFIIFDIDIKMVLTPRRSDITNLPFPGNTPINHSFD